MTERLEKLRTKAVSWCWHIVKRRLMPDNVLFEEGDLYCKLKTKCLPLDVVEDIGDHRMVEFACGLAKCNCVFDSLAKYECHYNTIHRNVCQTCSRIYPSSHLLEIHILETHDVMFTLLAQKQNMYQCLVEDCETRLKDGQARRDHMIKIHKYPANYRYDRTKHKPCQKKKGKSGQEIPIPTLDSTAVIMDTASDTMETRTDAMDTTNSTSVTGDIDTNTKSGRVFSYKVPNTICFGSGVSRGFHGGRGRGRGRGRKPNKHWHQQSKTELDTKVDIESVDMTDLSDALS